MTAMLMMIAALASAYEGSTDVSECTLFSKPSEQQALIM